VLVIVLLIDDGIVNDMGAESQTLGRHDVVSGSIRSPRCSLLLVSPSLM